MTALFGMLAVASVFTNAYGRYVADNRFEQYWAPARLLARHAFLWDPVRSLGRVRRDFWPAATGFAALAHGLGASAWFGERCWHALLLTVGAVGVVAFLQLFRARLGAAHVIAGFFYAFNPFSATFLVPSVLYLNYAVAPWLCVLFVQGVRKDRPWKRAAIFALIVFSTGNVNPPGLLYAASPIVPTALYLVLIEREVRWRTVVAWSAKAGMLAVLVSVAGILKAGLGAASIAENISGSELASKVNIASSWAESWRGLGFWLSYGRDRAGLWIPQGASYFESWPVVLATFAAPCIGLAALARMKWRPRILFAGMAVLALAMMVGSYSPPSPLGHLLLTAYSRVGVLAAMRNSYKAGAGLTLGMACLVGIGAEAARERFPPQRRYVPSVVVIALVAASSFPFWTGHLYSSRTQLSSVPAYWQDAVRWLNQQPDQSRVLVLPGSTSTSYRWGNVGDDILDALLTRPHVVSTGFPETSPEGANAIQAFEGWVESTQYVPGTFAPMARRLGIGAVLIRNDLDWQETGAVRPSALQALRSDPGLRLTATFGQPGENTAGNAPSDSSYLESTLPPVEVYYVVDATSQDRVTSAPAPLLLSGDAHAWPQLAEEGRLGGAAPIRYTGDIGQPALLHFLDQGAPLVVTDTNRRTVSVGTGFGQKTSYTLAADATLTRTPQSLFQEAGSQSVATYGDAQDIVASGTGTPLAGYQPWLRPANAFDGDGNTAWMTGGLANPVGGWVRADLKTPTVVSRVDILPATTGTRRVVRTATIILSGGTEIAVDLSSGRASTTFPPHRTSFIEVRIDAVVGLGLDPAGFAEITVPGLNLHEALQVPDDVFRAADTNPALMGRLSRADTTYQFQRLQSDVSPPEEPTLHRRFRTVAERSFSFGGLVRLAFSTPDSLLDQLAGSPVGAFGSSRYGGDIGSRGGLAVDGRLDTGWAAAPTAGETLTVHFPEQVVDHVDLAVGSGHLYSVITAVTVTVAGSSFGIDLTPVGACAFVAAGTTCPAGGHLSVPPVRASQIVVQVTAVQPKPGGAFGPLPMSILEVGYGAPTSPAPPTVLGGRCVSGIATIDGLDVPVRLSGTVSELTNDASLRGPQTIPFESCGPVSLGPGWHQLDTGGNLLVDQALLATNPALAHPIASAPVLQGRSPTSVEVLASSPDHVRLRVSAPNGGYLVFGESFDPGWGANTNGRSLGSSTTLDTLTGWALPSSGTFVVDLNYRPQRLYDVAFGVTLIAVAFCGWLAFRRDSSPS